MFGNTGMVNQLNLSVPSRSWNNSSLDCCYCECEFGLCSYFRPDLPPHWLLQWGGQVWSAGGVWEPDSEGVCGEVSEGRSSLCSCTRGSEVLLWRPLWQLWPGNRWVIHSAHATPHTTGNTHAKTEDTLSMDQECNTDEPCGLITQAHEDQWHQWIHPKYTGAVASYLSSGLYVHGMRNKLTGMWIYSGKY